MNAKRLLGAVLLVLIVLGGAFAGVVEWTHQKTQRPRTAFVRSLFGGVFGCGPQDEAERICRWAGQMVAAKGNEAERERLAVELRDSMCNPPVLGIFLAISAVRREDKARMLRQGFEEAGARLDCPDLDALWPAATAAPSPPTP